MIRHPDSCRMHPVRLYREMSRREERPVRALAIRVNRQRQIRYVMTARMSRAARSDWMKELRNA